MVEELFAKQWVAKNGLRVRPPLTTLIGHQDGSFGNE